MKTVELITELVEKEHEYIQTAEVMEQHHEQAKEDQYVESILAQYIGTALTQFTVKKLIEAKVTVCFTSYNFLSSKTL